MPNKRHFLKPAFASLITSFIRGTGSFVFIFRLGLFANKRSKFSPCNVNIYGQLLFTYAILFQIVKKKHHWTLRRQLSEKHGIKTVEEKNYKS